MKDYADLRRLFFRAFDFSAKKRIFVARNVLK